jgi:hypothetical protein
MPSDVDAMPEADYEDVMEVMWADEQNQQARKTS